ncbi:MAG: hypothetical protein KA297_10860 [Kofleriaceae bacterium]|nr:hypothetical protein [Kofleriaceae bacterium]
MTGRGVLLAAALVACGGGAPTAATGPHDQRVGASAGAADGLAVLGPAPDLVLRVRAPSTVARLAREARLVGGEGLASWMAIPLGEVPWSAAELTGRGVADAPLEVALIASTGLELHRAGVADRPRLEAEVSRVLPTTSPRRTGGASLWASEGPEGRVVLVDDTRFIVVAGGAASVRERTALALAESTPVRLVTPTPAGASGALAAPDVTLEVEASLAAATVLVEGALANPAVRAFADEVGRIHGAVAVTADEVTWNLRLAPRPGSLPDRLLRGAGLAPTPMLIPLGGVMLVSRVSPADAATALELAATARAGATVAMMTGVGNLPAVLTGQVGVSLAGISAELVDQSTISDAAATLSRTTGRILSSTGGLVQVGGERSVRLRGLGVAITAWRPTPPLPPAPPTATFADDDNADVPWSLPYRDTRARVTTLAERVEDAHKELLAARTKALHELGDDLRAVDLPLAADGAALSSRGHWKAPGGTLAEIDRRFDDTVTAAMAPARDKLRRRIADFELAYAEAVAQRARDVAAFDRARTKPR